MESANEMSERMSRVFEQEKLEAVYPSFYQSIEDDDESAGFIVNCTVVDCNWLAPASETKQRIEDSLRRLYYNDGCSHSHDCCGCWFTSHVKITIKPTRNIYGNSKACYDVTATFGYGRNV